MEGGDGWKEGSQEGKGVVENRRKVKGRGCKCAGCPYGLGVAGHALCDPSCLFYGLMLPSPSSRSSLNS